MNIINKNTIKGIWQVPYREKIEKTGDKYIEDLVYIGIFVFPKIIIKLDSKTTRILHH